MKNSLSFLSLATAAVLTFSNAANAADGTITINGEITDTTCSISVNGQAPDATLTLPTVSANTLNAAGETAGTTPFNITLTGCTNATQKNASTWFESGATVDSTSGRLNNSGTASNVQVELLNSAQNAIVAGSASQNDVPVDISSGSGTLSYYARYYATAPTTAGTVTTTVDYTIVYD
ncbi:MAG: fimbrial protein [Brachymonas sp.]